MATISLAQAIRNAIEGEYHAAKFYAMMARDNLDERAVRFFSKMAEQEVQHAQQIEGMGDLMGASELPAEPTVDIAGIETVRRVEGRTDLTYGEALRVALEAENNATRFYSLLSDLFEGDTSLLFGTIARSEAQHAENVGTLIEHLDQTEAARALVLPPEWLVSQDDEPTET